MYLLFLDNSYIDKGDLDVTCLGGFLIKDEQYDLLRAKLEDLKLSYGLTPLDPIKWSPPGHKDAKFKAIRQIENQKEFKKAVLKLLPMFDIKIFCVFINSNRKYLKELQRNKQLTKTFVQEHTLDYEKRAIEYLAQRFQMELQKLNKCCAKKEKGLILIENLPNDHSPKLLEYYKEIWYKGSGDFCMKFDLLFDSLTYSHDFSCDGLQLADFIVGSISDALKNSRYEYINLFKNKIARIDDKLKGIGLIVYPSSSKIIDNLIKKLD